MTERLGHDKNTFLKTPALAKRSLTSSCTCVRPEERCLKFEELGRSSDSDSRHEFSFPLIVQSRHQVYALNSTPTREWDAASRTAAVPTATSNAAKVSPSSAVCGRFLNDFSPSRPHLGSDVGRAMVFLKSATAQPSRVSHRGVGIRDRLQHVTESQRTLDGLSFGIRAFAGEFDSVENSVDF